MHARIFKKRMRTASAVEGVGVATSMLARRVAAGCYWATLRRHRASSGLAAVPLTAEHYAVKRGDYAQVGKNLVD